MILSNISFDSVSTLVISHDLGGFVRVSQQLGCTQTALSLQMKRLQEKIAVPIFRRQSRKLLTDRGEIALQYARRVLALSDEMVDTLRGSSMSSVARVGLVQDCTDNVLLLASNGSEPSIRLSNLR